MRATLFVLVAIALSSLSGCSLSAEAPPMMPLHQVGPSARCTIPWLPVRVRQHRALIEEAAMRHGVDANLVAIVVLVESGGDPRARSHAGAVGLMQLMPKTAADIARRRRIPRHRQERLTDARYNLDLGTWYLATQLKNNRSGVPAYDVALAAAAYNGGPGRLRRHLRTGEALPSETRRYQRLVTGMWQERTWPQSPTLNAWRQRRV